MLTTQFYFLYWSSSSFYYFFRHCEVFSPAAPRRAWLHVSEAISGLSLSRPVQIIGLSGIYPDNDLIRRSPILQRIAALDKRAFQRLLPIGYYSQFPKFIPVCRAGWLRVTEQYSVPCGTRFAWLSRTLIEVVSGGINRN